MSAWVIWSIKWFSVTSIDQKIFGSFWEAVTTIEAIFSKEWHLLQVHNHVFHQFEFSNHSLAVLLNMSSLQFKRFKGISENGTKMAWKGFMVELWFGYGWVGAVEVRFKWGLVIRILSLVMVWWEWLLGERIDSSDKLGSVKECLVRVLGFEVRFWGSKFWCQRIN